jgi:hypothetical protein
MVKFVLMIELKLANILLRPIFQYSIIPYSMQAFKPQKTSYIFIKLLKFRDVKLANHNIFFSIFNAVC